MDVRHFHRSLFESARRLIPHRAGVVCAVSGGADSVAMLHGLLRVNEIHDCGWRLVVAHLDHQLRPTSAGDADFVGRLAGELKLPFVCEALDVRAAAETTGQSIETTARELRYSFLRRVADSQSAGIVSVAHHADDQAETVLHRILRGAGLAGLAGMPRQRALGDGHALVRPMLGFWKRDIVAYCEAAGLAFREDDTNDDPEAATRNRIRHELIPLIEGAINPQVGRALVQLAEQATRAQEVIRSDAADALDACATRSIEGDWALEVTSLSNLPRAVTTEVLRLAIERSGAAMQSIGFERIEAAAELIDGDGQSRRVEMAGGVTIERRGGKLVLHVGEARPGRDNFDNHQIQEACR